MLIHIHNGHASVKSAAAQILISVHRGGGIEVHAYVNGESTSSSFHVNTRSPIEDAAVAAVRNAVSRVIAFDPEAFPEPKPDAPVMQTVQIRGGI